MGRTIIFVLLSIFIVFLFSGVISAIPVDDAFLKDKLILDLPEIENYFFHDREWYPEQNLYRLNVRYNKDETYYQKSEFLLTIHNSSLTDSFLENQIDTLWNFSLIEINRNKIFEGKAEAPAGTQRYVLWISDNTFIQGWNGDDLGTVINNNLFNALTEAYLEKYPSTYQSSEEQRVLYAEKVPDPNRFISIQPIWSSSLDKSGETITVSVLQFEWLSGETTSKAELTYLKDASGRYLSDGGTFSYSRTYEFTCDLGYDNCVSACGDDETCIDQCVRDYDCATESSCVIIGPDGSCGVESMTASFGITQLLLNFDPVTGQLVELDSTYNGEKLIIVTQSGFLSEEVFRAE